MESRSIHVSLSASLTTLRNYEASLSKHYTGYAGALRCMTPDHAKFVYHVRCQHNPSCRCISLFKMCEIQESCGTAGILDEVGRLGCGGPQNAMTE